MTVQYISAITLAVRDMARAVDFYGTIVGLELHTGSTSSSFSTFRVGEGFLNLVLVPEGGWTWWGRVIFHVDDVNILYQRLVDSGVTTTTAPRNARWGERYFHVNDPDGHELSFARRLEPQNRDGGDR